MKLIHKQTGQEVREGDTVIDFRGETGIVLGWTKPHSPASTGRITVLSGEDEHTCYPSVYDCEWIEREDRAPQGDPTQAIYGFAQPTPVGGFSDFKPDWNFLEVFPSAPIKPIYKDASSFTSVSTSDQINQLVHDAEEGLSQIQDALNKIKALFS